MVLREKQLLLEKKKLIGLIRINNCRRQHLSQTSRLCSAADCFVVNVTGIQSDFDKLQLNIFAFAGPICHPSKTCQTQGTLVINIKLVDFTGNSSSAVQTRIKWMMSLEYLTGNHCYTPQTSAVRPFKSCALLTAKWSLTGGYDESTITSHQRWYGLKVTVSYLPIYASHACKGSIRWRGTLAIMKGKKLLCMNKKKVSQKARVSFWR